MLHIVSDLNSVCGYLGRGDGSHNEAPRLFVTNVPKVEESDKGAMTKTEGIGNRHGGKRLFPRKQIFFLRREQTAPTWGVNRPSVENVFTLREE